MSFRVIISGNLCEGGKAQSYKYPRSRPGSFEKKSGPKMAVRDTISREAGMGQLFRLLFRLLKPWPGFLSASRTTHCFKEQVIREVLLAPSPPTSAPYISSLFPSLWGGTPPPSTISHTAPFFKPTSWQISKYAHQCLICPLGTGPQRLTNS